MTCIDSRLLPLPSPHVWMKQWGRRCGCRRAGRGCSSFRKIYVYISSCAVQNVVYVDCLAPPCVFIQSGSQIACRLLKQWNKAQAGVTADTRHGSLPSADVTFKTKPVSSLTYGRIVPASRTIACCHCATAVMTAQTLWHCGESNSAGSFLSTQLLFSLPAMRLWGRAVHQQITQQLTVARPHSQNEPITHSKEMFSPSENGWSLTLFFPAMKWIISPLQISGFSSCVFPYTPGHRLRWLKGTTSLWCGININSRIGLCTRKRGQWQSLLFVTKQWTLR